MKETHTRASMAVCYDSRVSVSRLTSKCVKTHEQVCQDSRVSVSRLTSKCVKTHEQVCQDSLASVSGKVASN